MKKLIPFAAAAVIFHLNFLQANGQSATDVAYTNTPKSARHTAVLNVKADKNFRREFKNIDNASWNEKEDGYRVRFNDKSIRYMIDYDKKGNWVSTIKSYDETKLSTQIANSVKTAFLGYAIAWVIELRVGNVTAHLVKIEDKQSLKTVRVINDELDVIEDYAKQ
jgi:hypothetical protein